MNGKAQDALPLRSDVHSGDATSTQNLKKCISDFLKKLGQGLCDPVPYETAWVARVPRADNLELPAFPLSLQWLRDNQLADGSWGTTQPFSPHSSTLNTLAAVVSLAQWNNPKDKILIERGIKALWNLVPKLRDEKNETIGFELILPALQSEARKYGLDIPHEHYFQYEQKSCKKRKLILCEFEKYGYSKPASWWHNLEILGDHSENNGSKNAIAFSPTMLINGSIAVSPSATAYLLRSQRLNGADVPEAEKYLLEMYTLYEGGISQVFPIDIFELAFSLDFFLRAGFSAKDPLLEASMNLLLERCASRQTVGFSSQFPLADADDTAVTLYVLHQAGHKVSVDDLLKFFNGNHFKTFTFEMNFSLSTNINALRILKSIQGSNNEIDEIIQKVTHFIEKYALSDEHVLINDKWHKSPYYCTSRAVSSLHGLSDNTVKNCIDFFVTSQNSDGGWGKDGFSTAEETAYVTLALIYGLKNGYHDVIPVAVLEAASSFLSNGDTRHDARLWIGKVLYRPTLVAESAILAARFALAKFLKFYNVHTRSLWESEFEFVNVTYTSSQWNYCAPLLLSSSEFDPSKYSEQLIRVEKYVVEKLIEFNLDHGESLMAMNPELFIYTIRCEVSDDHLIVYTLVSAAIFLYDDIFDSDYFLKDSREVNVGLIKETSRVFFNVLSGECPDVDAMPPLKFPKFTPLCQLFQEIRLRMASKLNFEEFLLEMKKVFDTYTEEFENRTRGTSLYSKTYLEKSRISALLPVMLIITCTFKDVNLSKFKDDTLFKQFVFHGSLASRLILDIFSVSRDIQKGSENYVLLKQDELGCSLKQSLDLTIKLYNRRVTKMKSLRKMIESDLSRSGKRNLREAISFIDAYVNGVIDWSSLTLRYKSKQNAELSVSLSGRQSRKFHPAFFLE